jgi:hypothetical protein
MNSDTIQMNSNIITHCYSYGDVIKKFYQRANDGYFDALSLCKIYEKSIYLHALYLCDVINEFDDNKISSFDRMWNIQPTATVSKGPGRQNAKHSVDCCRATGTLGYAAAEQLAPVEALSMEVSGMEVSRIEVSRMEVSREDAGLTYDLEKFSQKDLFPEENHWIPPKDAIYIAEIISDGLYNKILNLSSKYIDSQYPDSQYIDSHEKPLFHGDSINYCINEPKFDLNIEMPSALNNASFLDLNLVPQLDEPCNRSSFGTSLDLNIKIPSEPNNLSLLDLKSGPIEIPCSQLDESCSFNPEESAINKKRKLSVSESISEFESEQDNNQTKKMNLYSTEENHNDQIFIKTENNQINPALSLVVPSSKPDAKDNKVNLIPSSVVPSSKVDAKDNKANFIRNSLKENKCAFIPVRPQVSPILDKKQTIITKDNITMEITSTVCEQKGEHNFTQIPIKPNTPPAKAGVGLTNCTISVNATRKTNKRKYKSHDAFNINAYVNEAIKINNKNIINENITGLKYDGRTIIINTDIFYKWYSKIRCAYVGDNILPASLFGKFNKCESNIFVNPTNQIKYYRYLKITYLNYMYLLDFDKNKINYLRGLLLNDNRAIIICTRVDWGFIDEKYFICPTKK